uniref:Uncharacterized protein n=1 Tax=Vespula pensylvanica TaxID=30213 RepID=A0A834UAM9_VESPE|nr:hypothetical protein H0235_006539 [Vespula pensylvanica]
MRGLPLELPRSAPASSDLCEDDLSLQRTRRNLKKFMLWITAAAETSKDDIFRVCTVKFALAFISIQMQLCGFDERRALQRATLDDRHARSGRTEWGVLWSGTEPLGLRGPTWLESGRPGTRFLSPSLECTSGHPAACKY